MNSLVRKLSFVHLAPIPEVPLEMPKDPDPKKILLLLELVDIMLEESSR